MPNRSYDDILRSIYGGGGQQKPELTGSGDAVNLGATKFDMGAWGQFLNAQPPNSNAIQTPGAFFSPTQGWTGTPETARSPLGYSTDKFGRTLYNGQLIGGRR